MVVTQEGDTVVIFQLMMKKLVSFKKQAISVKLASAEKYKSIYLWSASPRVLWKKCVFAGSSLCALDLPPRSE